MFPALTAGQSADMHAYGILKKAADELRERRYSMAMRTLSEVDRLDGLADITVTQAAAAMTRAAIGMGDYAMAREAYARGRMYSPDGEADDMLRLVGSELCFAVGDFDKALALTDSVTTPRYATTRAAHRVRALTMLGRYNDAVASADSALSCAGNGGEDSRAVLLQNRGYACWEAGLLDEAAANLRDAAASMSDRTDRLNMLGNLAMVESETGEHVAALRHIRQALRGLSADTPDGLTARRKYAEILRRAGRRKEAMKEFRAYFDGEKAALKANLPSMSPSERLNYWVKEKNLLSRCFEERSDAEFLYDVAVFRRLTSLLGMRDSVKIEGLLDVGAKDVRKALGKEEAAVEIVSYALSRDRRAYAAIVLPGRGRAAFVPLIDEEEIYAPETVGFNSIYNALKRESIDEKNLLYSDTVIAERIWRPIIDALPAGVSEIYFAPEGIFHLWGIENMPFRDGKDYRLHRVSSTAALVGRGERTHGRGNALVIGGLDYNRADGDREAGSGNSEAYEMLRSRGGAVRFGYLKGTLAEADSIGRAMDDAVVAHAMGEARLKSIMRDYDLVHIATHGYSLDFGMRKRPEFLADSTAIDCSLSCSGLALSGANAGYDPVCGEDGLLSAREICEMDLGKVDFVVMSACRTALGNVSDEGAAGLVRALKMAGVRSIIATLWEVDDMSTMLFMQAFHKALAAGKGKHDSFLYARERVRDIPTTVSYRPFSARTMARESVPRTKIIPPFSEPYYWAPFILIDDF